MVIFAGVSLILFCKKFSTETEYFQLNQEKMIFFKKKYFKNLHLLETFINFALDLIIS